MITLLEEKDGSLIVVDNGMNTVFSFSVGRLFPIIQNTVIIAIIIELNEICCFRDFYVLPANSYISYTHFRLVP